MKRLLGFLCLIFSILFLSCNNDLSDKTGDISFSFAVNDAIRAADMSRADSIDEQDSYVEKEYFFLVQVKGSRNFYDYQIKSVRIRDNTEEISEGQITFPIDQDITTYTAADECGDYVNENEAELNFTFGYVPTNQTYKVMFDMFEKVPRVNAQTGSTQQQYETIHVLSGRSTDIEVLRGMPSSVEVDIDSFELSPISIVVEDEDGNIHYSNSPRAKAYSYLNNDNATSNVYKKYGKLWYEEQGNENNEDAYYPIKNIYYSLDPDSNYPDSSFKISVPGSYGYNETPTEGFSFQGTNGSLYDFLSKYSFPTGVGELTLGSPATISKDNLSFTENMPEIIFDSQDEVKSGHLSNTIHFMKKTFDGSENVLISSPNLNELIDIDLESIPERSSIALVLTAKQDNPLITNGNFFFKMVDYFNLGNVGLDGLYEGSSCQTHKPGDRRYVIPLMNVDVLPNSDLDLVMFIQCDANTTDWYIPFDIYYYIFPSDTFIFGIEVEKDADENYLYRHEMDEYFYPSGDPNLSENEARATLSGVICNFNLADKSYSLARTGLNADFYNNSGSFSSATNEVSGDIRFIQTDGTCDFNRANSYQFKFVNIDDWSTCMDSIKFLCHTSCNDTNTLLVIRDFDLEINTAQN